MQPHIWVRAEQRNNEQRVGLTPKSAESLLGAGFKVTVEHSSCRAIPIAGYRALDCEIVAENSWPDAPRDAIIMGLKELPDDGTPLIHRHIMFGHAYKGQAEGPALLKRFVAGGGTLYDLEYLPSENGMGITAFSYWAGFAGAAVAIMVWAAQQSGDKPGPGAVSTYPDKDTLLNELKQSLSDAINSGARNPDALIIGALGRVGKGAVDLLQNLGIATTKWDMEQTASGGPFPEILEHSLFINCILASPNVPVFLPKSALTAPRKLSVVADIACDPNSSYNPVPIYDEPTSFTSPVIRVANASPPTTPPLDVTAIDNLPSMLPIQSSQDFARELLPVLLTANDTNQGAWAGAKTVFDEQVKLL